MINGGALEERRDSTAEKRVCACRMLGVQDAGPVVGLGAARKGFRVSTGSMLFCMLILVLLLLLFLKSL